MAGGMRYPLACGTILSLALIARPALAQEAGTAPAEPSAAAEAGAADEGLQDIVVTARRRDESLQRVPLAVTAISGQELVQANVTRMENLGQVAPALIVAPTQGRTNVPGFAIRGQRQDTVFLTNDASVGIYFADAVQGRAFGLAQSLYDLESVQVLKGPQGTLFGRNTTGGAILFQPQRPNLDRFEGYAQARYGNYDRFDIQGALNLPINDVLAARVAFNRTRMDGFVRVVSTGDRRNSEHTDSVRATVLLRPGPSFSNTFYVDYFESDASGAAQRLTAVNPAGTAQRLFNLQAILDQQNRDFGPFDTDAEAPVYSRGSNLGFTNVSVADLSDRLTVKNILNFRRIRSTEAQDQDGTAASVLSVLDIAEVDQITEELQFQGRTADDRLTVIAGGYFFEESGTRFVLVDAVRGPINPRSQRSTNTSQSLFVQGDYRIVDNLTLTLGGRYTWETRDFAQELRSASTNACIFCNASRASWRAPTYTVSLSWQIDRDRLLYAATRRGFRSGGFNSGASNAAAAAPFNPEFVTDYEIGFKADWQLGGSQLRTNVAVYRTNYTDIQRSLTIPINNSPVVSIFNAASANITGFELEAKFIPVPGIEVNASTAFTDTSYNEFQYRDVAGNLIDQSANRFAYIPRWTYRLDARARLYRSAGDQNELSISANYYWQSSVFFSEFNGPLNRQSSYGLLGARLELRNAGGSGFTAALWARNLTNTLYAPGASDQFTGLGLVYESYGEPRMYGAEMSFRF